MTTATDLIPPSTSELPAPSPDVDAFAERMFAAVLGAQEVQAAYLGDRLGWYRALAEHGPLTSAELAERTDTDERYAREWLEHQAACAWVVVDDATKPAADRRFTLPAAHAEALTDDDSLAFVAPFARFIAGLGVHLPRIAEAYRSGEGISWDELGEDARAAQAAANRPLFLHALGDEVLPAIPEVHERLLAGGRVCDVGCGAGWSSIGMASSFPGVTVDGIDLDGPSIDAARGNAGTAGLADRVRFHEADAATFGAEQGPFDVVTAFECIHDLSDPVGVLSAMRTLAGADGAVLVMDERVGESFAGPADELERFFYGFSLTCCLPDGRSRAPSAATGTVMRAGTLAAYAEQAGFSRLEVLDVEHEVFRFYLLHH
jgi:SAM-dependent methyltransferase